MPYLAHHRATATNACHRAMRMRRTGPEPADAYGHPTGGTYTLGVAYSRSRTPRPKHPRPSGRPEWPGGARAAGPRFGDHLQVLTDKFTAHSTAGTPTGPRGEGEPGSILRRSRYTGLARGPHGAAGTPDWPAGGGREGRANAESEFQIAKKQKKQNFRYLASNPEVSSRGILTLLAI